MNNVRGLHTHAMACYDQSRRYERDGEIGLALEYMREAADNEQAALDATPKGVEPTTTILRNSVAAMRAQVERLQRKEPTP